MREKIKRLLKPRIKLVPGTRLTSLLFIGLSVLIAAGILIAANIYYNIDTGEVILEHIQRVTQVIRATGGLIVGGGPTQDLESGYVFQVVGQSKLATTTLEGYLIAINSSEAPIRFATSSTGYYVGFKAPTNLATTTIYTWPTNYPDESGYFLQADASGILSWVSATSSGLGTITQVGEVKSGGAFISSPGNYGNTLWFHPDATYTMALTAASGLTANATTIIPAVSGTTTYLTLTPSALTSGQVLLATGPYTLGGDANLNFATSTRTLTIGSSGNSGQLIIYSSVAGYYLGFAATSTMTTSTLYYWPKEIPTDATGSKTYILKTDAAGNLSWTTVPGAGGITGTGSGGQVAFWDDTSSITGSENFMWSTSTNTLTINGSIVATGSVAEIIALKFTGPSHATTTIASTGTQNILLDPATGKIYLGSSAGFSAYIITASGYEIGRSGTEILVGMIPILGFDLPVQTATTSFVQISRKINDCGFPDPATGTTRVYKFVIRYTDNLPIGSSTNWRVSTTSGVAYSTFTLPAVNDSDLASGTVAIVTPSNGVPCDDYPWWLEVQSLPPYPSNKIKVFQIFLAAYDQIQ